MEGSDVKQEWTFWINGKYLDINTSALAEYFRSFPEPVPFELIRGFCSTDDLPSGSSAISHLSSSWCLWTAVLKDELARLMKEAFKHHRVIIESMDEWSGVGLVEEMKVFARRMNELWIILEHLEVSPPLSVWATSEDDVDESVRKFGSNSETWFDQVTNFDHIKSEIMRKESGYGMRKRRLRHYEAKFNKYKKDLLRGSG